MPPRPSSTLQIKGRKRHALVDTDGRALKLQVHAADIQDVRIRPVSIAWWV